VNASIQGTWTGTATSLSASGTCLADNFQPLTVPVRWIFQQTGGSFTAMETLNNAITCPFTGTVSGNTVTFAPGLARSPAGCGDQDLPCISTRGGIQLVHAALQASRSIETGTVNGSQMKLAGTSIWKVTDVQTGAALGEFQVTGSQDLQKQ
jgi:hypothetical protein